MTSSVWIEDMHNLHCPTCDSRLVQPAGKHKVLERPDPVYTGGPSVCPQGHDLPDDQALAAYAEQAGHEAGAPFREVPPPAGRRP